MLDDVVVIGHDIDELGTCAVRLILNVFHNYRYLRAWKLDFNKKGKGEEKEGATTERRGDDGKEGRRRKGETATERRDGDGKEGQRRD